MSNPSSIKASTMPSFGFTWASHRCAGQTGLTKHLNVEKYISESCKNHGPLGLSRCQVLFCIFAGVHACWFFLSFSRNLDVKPLTWFSTLCLAPVIPFINLIFSSHL